VAYADPPYLGCCRLYEHRHDGEFVSGCWDDLATHALLITALCDSFPDGWVLSCSTPSLRALLPLCPDDVRVGAWVKPFAVFKPNVNPAYAWEPVIWRGGRTKRSREELTVRDWVSSEITLRKGLTGAKPEAFVWWLFGLLGLERGDDLHDVFTGSGVVGRVHRQFIQQLNIADAALEGE
jgi:hypothetical protein